MRFIHLTQHNDRVLSVPPGAIMALAMEKANSKHVLTKVFVLSGESWVVKDSIPVIERMCAQAEREPKRRKAKAEKPGYGGRRLWTMVHCPNCGTPGIEFIGQSEFAQRSSGRGTSRGGIIRKIRSGVYCVDGSGRLPWCRLCGEKTPEGAGIATREE